MVAEISAISHCDRSERQSEQFSFPIYIYIYIYREGERERERERETNGSCLYSIRGCLVFYNLIVHRNITLL